MLTTIIGLLLGLAIGAGCRWFDIPAPSPPKIVGALLVVFMTLGYLATDYVMTKTSSPSPVTIAVPASTSGVAHD
jgi:XapX domain-containing protein